VLDRLETLENAAGNQGGQMRRFIAPFRPMLALLALVIVQSTEAGGQTTTPTQQEPTQVVKTLPPTPSAKDLEGKDAFSSDSQQLGKVAKANTLADGNVKDIEIQSSGFLGFFSKTYVVPADKASVKGGRVEISMTSDQVKQLAK
jgi:PRC-barrel domain